MDNKNLMKTVVEEYEIREVLNNEYYDDIFEDSITIKGIVFSYLDESNGDDLKESFTSEDGSLQFTREGFKVISYERWVDTNWYDWE